MEATVPIVPTSRRPTLGAALRFWAWALPALAVAWWLRFMLSDAIQAGMDALPQDRFRGRIGAGSAFWVIVGRGVQVGTLLLLIAGSLAVLVRPFRRARGNGG